MPGKHMFAIMDHIECVSWLSFSEKYWLSSFLRLDNTVVNEDGIANLPIDDDIFENNIEKSQVKENKYNVRNVFLWKDQKHLFVENCWLDGFYVQCFVM